MKTLRFFTRSVARSLRTRELGAAWRYYYEIY